MRPNFSRGVSHGPWSGRTGQGLGAGRERRGWPGRLQGSKQEVDTTCTERPPGFGGPPCVARPHVVAAGQQAASGERFGRPGPAFPEKSAPLSGDRLRSYALAVGPPIRDPDRTVVSYIHIRGYCKENRRARVRRLPPPAPAGAPDLVVPCQASLAACHSRAQALRPPPVPPSPVPLGRLLLLLMVRPADRGAPVDNALSPRPTCRLRAGMAWPGRTTWPR